MNVLIDKNYITAIADNSFVPAYGGSTTRNPETPDQIVTQIGNVSTQGGLHELAKIVNGATNKALKMSNTDWPNYLGPGRKAKHIILSASVQFYAQSFQVSNCLTAFYSKDANLREWSSAANAGFKATDPITDIYTDATSAPSNWGSYATKKGNTQITVHYGVTEDEYLELVDSYTPPTTT